MKVDPHSIRHWILQLHISSISYPIAFDRHPSTMLLNRLMTASTQPSLALCSEDEHSPISVNNADAEYSSDSESCASDDVEEQDVGILARKIILDYFERTRVHDRFGSRVALPEVEKKVREKIKSKNLPIPAKLIEKYTMTGLDIVATAYRFIPSVDTQVSIALCTFCTALFDDGIMGAEAMREYVPRFVAGLPQLHPVLDFFAETMTGMRPQFTAYGANAMISSMMDFTNSEMFLREGGEITLGPASSSYIEYIRLKEGYGEAYATFIWPVCMFSETRRYLQAFPDSMNFINLINDMFSYYKEAKAGETGTYLHCFSKVHGLTIPQTLQNIVDQTVTVVKRIRAVLGDTPEREAWENFAAGYTQFHLHTARYKLHEILPEYY